MLLHLCEPQGEFILFVFDMGVLLLRLFGFRVQGRFQVSLGFRLRRF